MLVMQDAGYSTYEIRVRAVNAVNEGMAVTDVATAYCVDRSTVHRWLQRYGDDGNNGLVRKPVGGRPRKLAQLTVDDLRGIVLQPASAFGYETDFWTSKRLQHVLDQEFQVRVSNRTVLRRLHEAGLTYQKPERQYFELNEAERQEWIANDLPKIREKVRETRALLYFQDEASISLTALLGKTWSPRGQTPKQRVTGKRGAVSALSAINARGRLIFQLHDKRIASPEVIAFLAQMLQYHKRRHLVVVMDQAPPHVSKKTRSYVDSQRRLHVFHLPTYSPDWNPDEKVWNHLKHQELKGHQAKDKNEIKELANGKLDNMSKNPELLRGIFYRCCVAELLA